MKKYFVTYAIAIAFKELGFNESCFATYIEPAKLVHAGLYDKLTPKEKELLFSNKYPFCNSENTTTAPMWEQATEWLLNEYDLKIVQALNTGWEVGMKHDDVAAMGMYFCGYTLPTREGAILKAIEIIKNKLVKKLNTTTNEKV